MDRVRMFPDGFLIALVGKQIVGYIESVLWGSHEFASFEDIKRFPLFADEKGDELYIIFLATVAKYRKRGIATELLEATKKVARKRRASQVTLVSGENLQNFYEKRGFTKIRELPGFLDSIGGMFMACAV
jgi:Acetyltransferases